MSHVFVVDTNKQPLNPVHPARARKLLSCGRAAVYRRYPFTIILKVAIANPVVADLRIKLDPGSKTTGIAVVNDSSSKVVFAAELSHRGSAIKDENVLIVERKTSLCKLSILSHAPKVARIGSRICVLHVRSAI